MFDTNFIPIFNSEIMTEPRVANIKIEFESENNGMAQRRHRQICYKEGSENSFALTL